VQRSTEIQLTFMAVFIVTADFFFQSIANGLVFAADNNDCARACSFTVTLKARQPVILYPRFDVLINGFLGQKCT